MRFPTVHVLLTGSLLASALMAQGWSFVPTANNPGDRIDASAAFDVARNRTVLFGGGAVGVFPTDTWTYDGSNWSVASPTTSPPGRHRHAMAYDIARGVVVMFGGTGTSGPLNDTWEWDGTNWTQVFPATPPPARYAHSMAFDLGRGVTVMYGGTTSEIQPRTRTDTWEWSGTNWTQVVAAGPPQAEDTAMCYDMGRAVIVLAGGTSFFGAPDQSTWEYNGINWTNVTSSVGPGPSSIPGLGVSDAQMVYDVNRSACVLHGGRTPNGTFPVETWEYDGTAWTLVSSGGPGSRTRFVLAMDFLRDKVVLYGGTNGAFTVSYRDTWEFRGRAPASYTTFGLGCPSSVGVATNTASALPRIGQTMMIDIGNVPSPEVAVLIIGTSSTMSAYGPLPLNLGALGMPGCSAQVSDDALVAFAFGAGGSVGYAVGIPNDSFFIGLPIFTQAMVFQTGVNAFGAVMSNAAAAIIGS